MNFSEKQKQIIETNAQRALVIASAAAGKTAVITERIRFLLNNGVPAEKIVALTFTNAAAAEIAERLGRPPGLFVGTIHGYANYLLVSGGVATKEFLDKEQFDRLFECIKQHPECVKTVQYLLLDEAQDSTDQQFEFLLDVVAPLNWMLMGDHRQSIYSGWAGANPQYLIDLTYDPTVTCYNLNENYRNGSKILDYARGIIRLAGIDYIDRSIPMRGVSGKVIEVEYSSTAIARSIKNAGQDWNKWFILTRTNKEIDIICKTLKVEGVPFDTFKRAEMDNNQLAEKMKENTVKVLTIHTAKGLEADNVVVIGAKYYNIEEKCISYVAATRAKNLLVWTRQPSRRKIATEVWE